MGEIFDLHAAVVAAGMGGEFGDAVEDAHALLVGDDTERAPHMRVRHRVVVQIEAHIRRLADLHRHPLAEGELALGQRQQARAFDLERLVWLFRVGLVHFVKDGHHRIAVARAMGWKTIRAIVTEVETAFRSARSVNSSAAKKASRT